MLDINFTIVLPNSQSTLLPRSFFFPLWQEHIFVKYLILIFFGVFSYAFVKYFTSIIISFIFVGSFGHCFEIITFFHFDKFVNVFGMLMYTKSVSLLSFVDGQRKRVELFSLHKMVLFWKSQRVTNISLHK